MRAHRYGDRFNRSLDTELIDVLQHDEAARRFEDEIDARLEAFDSEQERFKDYAEEQLSDAFRVTRQ